MIRYTTPTFKLYIYKNDKTVYDMSFVKDGLVVFTQNEKKVIEKPLSECEIEKNAIKVFLSQTETGLFSVGNAEIQAILNNKDGTVFATTPRLVMVKKILSEKVFE